jgi:hypothetical protein|tara:strand:+ start:1228 stop:1356 length:129 start_codon:yes stop_codon:yes gene_type:complete
MSEKKDVGMLLVELSALNSKKDKTPEDELRIMDIEQILEPVF